MLRRRVLLALFPTVLAGAAHAQCDPSIEIVNRSGLTIREYYVRPSGQSDWGADALGTQVLRNRARLRSPTRGPGLHDFRILWVHGGTAQLMRIDICTTTRIIATPTQLEPARPRPPAETARPRRRP